MASVVGGRSLRSRVAAAFDHTQVRAYATQTDIDELCSEAVGYGFRAVCVNPAWTSYCAKRLKPTGVRVCPVIGFPLGAATAHIKVEEAREALKHGAHELDMVINIGALKSGFPQFVEKEIHAVVRAAAGAPVKVILEASYLSDQEKASVCEMSIRAGAAFVQTGTGFGAAGAQLEDVRLLHRVAAGRIGVKAAGGVRSYRIAMALLEGGAARLGSSACPGIMDEMPAE